MRGKSDSREIIYSIKRVVAKTFMGYGAIMEEGKKGISFDVKNNLCGLLHHLEGYDYIFAHNVLTMEWNSMAIGKIA